METPLLDGIIKSAAMDLAKEAGLRGIFKQVAGATSRAAPNLADYARGLGAKGPATAMRVARGTADRGVKVLFSLLSRGGIKGGRAGTYARRASKALANRMYTDAAGAVNADTASMIDRLAKLTRVPV